MIDDCVDHYVIVEADTAEKANNRAEKIGIYFNGCEDNLDCECCGDRWYEQYDDTDGDPTPMVYERPFELFAIGYEGNEVDRSAIRHFGRVVHVYYENGEHVSIDAHGKKEEKSD